MRWSVDKDILSSQTNGELRPKGRAGRSHLRSRLATGSISVRYKPQISTASNNVGNRVRDQGVGIQILSPRPMYRDSASLPSSIILPLQRQFTRPGGTPVLSFMCCSKRSTASRIPRVMQSGQISTVLPFGWSCHQVSLETEGVCTAHSGIAPLQPSASASARTLDFLIATPPKHLRTYST